MSKVYIYLAGPVAGKDDTEANEWRNIVTAALATVSPNIIGVTPLRYEPVTHPAGRYLKEGEYSLNQSQQITAKNRLDVRRCDLTFAYLPSLSTGTFLEMGWAFGHDKPIIVVSPLLEVLEHPVVMGTAAWRFNSQEGGFKDAMLCIKGLFEVYAT